MQSGDRSHATLPALDALVASGVFTFAGRSDANLRALDALVASGVLTYAGWRVDVKDAEMCHCKLPNLDRKLQAMRTKQKMHSGDRSHANLRDLDALLASGLTYAGWQNDVKEVEECHVEYPMLVDRSLQKMRKKQEMRSSDRSHATLRALDALVASDLTYASWQDDVKGVEEDHVNYVWPHIQMTAS
jgi:hypothetical protein